MNSKEGRKKLKLNRLKPEMIYRMFFLIIIRIVDNMNSY